MKKNLPIIIIALIAISYILINEINMRPKINLINDAKKIQNNISNLNLKDLHSQVIIDNGYKIEKNNYKIKGNGVIFLEKDYSFFLQRNGMCAIKMSYNKDIMFQNKPCPNYRMIKQFKFPIQTKKDGLYKYKNSYIFKGKDVNNYISFEDDLWRIYEINNNYIKLVSSLFYDNNISNELTKKEFENTINDYRSYLVKNKLYETKIITNYIYDSGSGLEEDPYIVKAE